MRQYHRRKALRYAETDKKQKQRYTRDDICVHHRNGIGEVHHLPGALPEVEDADGCKAAQEGTGSGGNQRDDKGVSYRTHQRVVHAAREE